MWNSVWKQMFFLGLMPFTITRYLWWGNFFLLISCFTNTSQPRSVVWALCLIVCNKLRFPNVQEIIASSYECTEKIGWRLTTKKDIFSIYPFKAFYLGQFQQRQSVSGHHIKKLPHECNSPLLLHIWSSLYQSQVGSLHCLSSYVIH